MGLITEDDLVLKREDWPHLYAWLDQVVLDYDPEKEVEWTLPSLEGQFIRGPEHD